MTTTLPVKYAEHFSHFFARRPKYFIRPILSSFDFCPPPFCREVFLPVPVTGSGEESPCGSTGQLRAVCRIPVRMSKDGMSRMVSIVHVQSSIVGITPAANWNVQTSGPWPLNKVHVLTYVVRHKNRSSSIEMAVASWQHERTMKESQCVQTNRRRAGPSEG